MLIQKQFLGKLRSFGLNTYESKLWTALLSRGVSTAGELSDIANVPRSRSYDVLESLEKKGFIIMKIGKPIKYIAVPPSEVIERVKKSIREDADDKTKTLDSLKSSEVLTELNTLHTQGIDLVEPSDLTGALKGRASVYTHLESMIKNAKKSVIIMTSAAGLARKAEALKQAMAKAKERGVTVRIVVPDSKEAQEASKTFKGAADVKLSSAVHSRFVVTDNKEVVFMLLDDATVHPTYDTCVWVNSGFFAQTLTNHFDMIWNN